jgi:Cu/Zn superoxide dismutase
MRRLIALTLAFFLLAPTEQVSAHGMGESYDLPLPLWLYLFGAAAVVLISFFQVGIFATERHTLHRYPRFNLLRIGPFQALFTAPPFLFFLRLLSVMLFLLVVVSGLFGQQSPDINFAPTFVWVVWWVGFSFFTAFIGNLWPLVNPWKVIFEWAKGLAKRLGFEKGLKLKEPLSRSWGIWPALVLYAVFVWTELVFWGSTVPFDISVLILLYSGLTWGGMAVFGKEAWVGRGEAFSVFFGILARFAPTEVRVTNPGLCQSCASSACEATAGGGVNCYECFARAKPEDRELNLRPWAVGLARAEEVPPGGLVFVVFVLAAVAYDSLLSTPLWVRLDELTAMPQTLGLVAMPLFFLAAYLGFVKMAQLLGGGYVPFGRLAAAYVYSLVPIAIAYQVAHYYTLFLIQGQAIFALVSDPFGWGWDLFGTAGYGIYAGLVDAAFVWYSQVALIVAGHVIGMYIAHVVSLRFLRDRSLAMRSQYPMLVLMVLYTVFSLWLLSGPGAETDRSEQQGARPTADLTVDLRDSEGNPVGTAKLFGRPEGVRIEIQLQQGQQAIGPGEHAVHIHERGDISPDFGAAGEHFNSTGAQHGFQNSEGPHAGDLGNINVLADGSGTYVSDNDRVTLSGGGNGLLDEDGSALVIHEKADDYQTDPEGGSGDRAAAGVIE